MTYDPAKHHRHSIRLKGYDYTQPGGYFITIVTQDRACLFGEVVDDEMRLNEMGEIVRACWMDIPAHFPFAAVDEFVVMPNHVHGIIVLGETRATVGATHASPLPLPSHASSLPSHASPLPSHASLQRNGPQPQSIGAIVGSFKSAAARRINQIRGTPGGPVWQRNYYEHIIRNEESLNRIRQYILNNPVRWQLDRENPTATVPEPEDAWRL